MSDESIAWLRDVDGSGSLHVCSKGDPGAIEVFTQPARYTDKDATIARLSAENKRLRKASQKVLDGLNARIDAADKSCVPVFYGIVDLHDALSARPKPRRKAGAPS